MPPGDEKWAVESADEDSEVKSQPIKLPKREGKPQDNIPTGKSVLKAREREMIQSKSLKGNFQTASDDGKGHGDGSRENTDSDEGLDLGNKIIKSSGVCTCKYTK
ncbi:hypothetical protein K443DRAFT_120411 [Laccaria amethystina LaAM-08-1]|uniref:Uncharacterized protein n=1 Tax=Laccaria amethystina LaAM-08-1 TaxID=1095629 RepID=A0A0C9X196_9AGAR|nr:hypothetical protein K443DRAFT_120411 [Laccaria amethystina LaAM-08-1]